MSDLKRKSPSPIIPVDVRTEKYLKTRQASLKVRLPKTYENLLPDLLLLDVSKAEYVQLHSPKSSYLYSITACLLDCSTEEIELRTTKDGDDAGDEESVWTVLANDDKCYESGVYVCRPLYELNEIWVEKIFRGDSSDSTGRRANTPATPSKVRTPQTAHTIPASISTHPQSSPSNMAPPPTPPKKTAQTNSSATTFRTRVIQRDQQCIMTQTKANAAKASHLIPQHLLSAVQSMGGVVTGKQTFLDPYDEHVGVLVAPDIDHHIDRFEAGFFVNADNVDFQVFCTHLLPSEKYFTPTAWQCRHQKASVDLSDKLREVMNWHFKHCLILSWGGFSLISYIRSFLIADDNMDAWSFDSEDGYLENPSPASSTADFFWSSAGLTD